MKDGAARPGTRGDPGETGPALPAIPRAPAPLSIPAGDFNNNNNSLAVFWNSWIAPRPLCETPDARALACLRAFDARIAMKVGSVSNR